MGKVSEVISSSESVERYSEGMEVFLNTDYVSLMDERCCLEPFKIDKSLGDKVYMVSNSILGTGLIITEDKIDERRTLSHIYNTFKDENEKQVAHKEEKYIDLIKENMIVETNCGSRYIVVCFGLNEKTLISRDRYLSLGNYRDKLSVLEHFNDNLKSKINSGLTICKIYKSQSGEAHSIDDMLSLAASIKPDLIFSADNARDGLSSLVN